ncbi:AAA family ATPase [Mariniblastus sp.]|nr:AAA family ATPase [Mariniblastus sp.]
MSKDKLDLPPPFLKGVYLRDEFDFEKRGSAIQGQQVQEIEPTQQEDDSANSTLFMTDDEFINSLVTDDPDATSLAEPVPYSHSEPERESELLSPDPKVSNVARKDRFPFAIPWVGNFELEFKTAVTFLVGENGSGKSTLIEAIAALSGFPVCGGGRNDLASQFGPERTSELSEAMYTHFTKRPRDGYFFRAEFYAQFASLLDQRKRDPEFKADPYMRYGGKSPHTRSHGESFLDLLNNRLGDGLFLMDEPEAALSPQRQLSLLAIMAQRVRSKKTQFIVATHSPILMTFPGATILNLDTESIHETTLEETSHYQLTQGILDFPEKYWKHLME